MEAEFNIVKIIKNLRNLKIMMKRQFITDKKLMINIQNSGKNIINLDSSDES